jgi:hypothetical protein
VELDGVEGGTGLYDGHSVVPAEHTKVPGRYVEHTVEWGFWHGPAVPGQHAGHDRGAGAGGVSTKHSKDMASQRR